MDPSILSAAFRSHVLCTRCGSCTGVCPEAAIVTGENGFPRLIPEKCTQCGLCGDVCPGQTVRFDALTEQVFGKRIPDEGFDGHVRQNLVGYAADERLRAGGAGGGVVTGLLAHWLRSGAVDGCLVTRMNRERPWEGEPFIATTEEELRASQGSRYHIIPVNSLWAQLRTRPGRYAAALLPCQMHGYRYLQRVDPALARRLPRTIGLFCGGSLEPCLTREMMAMRRIRREDIVDFQFRGGAWPGRMQVILRDGRAVPLHYSNYKDGAYNYFTLLYMPERCQTCLDGSNEFSDISVSDAWTRDEQGEYKFANQSRILVRTPDGAEWIREAVESGALRTLDVTQDPSYRTHRMQTRRKGSLAPLRVERWKRAGRIVPEYDRSAPADATRGERIHERMASAALRAGRWKPFRMAIMGFLTSWAALPLIWIRMFLKKRKYARRRKAAAAAARGG